MDELQTDETPGDPITSGDGVSGRDRMRAHIVEVAARLLAAGGRDAVSTRAVATAAGTQAPTIYRLFGDKDGLLAAVLEYGFSTYLADKPPLDPTADPITDLRAGWDLHIGFGLANPALFLLMHADTQPGRRPAAAEAGLAILRTRIRNIAAAGRLRVDEGLAAELVQAAGSGAVLALLAVPEESRDPRLADAMFNALITAITTDPAHHETADDRARADAGVVTAANALRARLPELEMLTEGERHVLGEWLARITH
ncbi:TetR family transcriptional regulator [Kribbella sp. VKM Ac-2569]|uniref:TetR/AcrR family transcriptional regulator n=1 Tax=Kribbella sp. VKM Ac-2569 TaxID=2512220 RepID=UPI0010EC79FD|nr:TetR/AcrR family transcriptional regulator [Kribbella sp. VKM Ac-2569]RZT19553.1 TetR family transcriptional regulator [Kribbella sp. VKM Ac-2569]